MMVLVDSSVWIRFIGKREPYVKGLDALLARDEVVGHEFIFGELLVGDSGGRTKLLGAYCKIHHASVVSHDDVVSFVRARGLHGRGLAWIDVHLLASTLVGNYLLWTADAALHEAADALGVAYLPDR
jgi:predicted nucleic acid-binding protein